MNMPQETAIAALDEELAARDAFPKSVYVGSGLFKALYEADRVKLANSVFGYTHFILDQELLIVTDPCLDSWDFRFED